MELISKQSKDIMEQEVIIKMNVADLIILESAISSLTSEEMFSALHDSSQLCQSDEWEIYNGKYGIFEYMRKNQDCNFDLVKSQLRKLFENAFNINRNY